ncbi:hypothetical protein B0H14DRAFT_2626443 [Mycena olivaceomarginata]|nr:hypothetical protein B0H14DRAFT_2626443 [Mycena olivaceomarginata]
MADIILDLMVTGEIERRRDPTRKSQTPFLKKLLTRLAFHVYQIGEQRILSNILVPAEPDCFDDLGEQHAVSNISSPTEDDSFDELDFLHGTMVQGDGRQLLAAPRRPFWMRCTEQGGFQRYTFSHYLHRPLRCGLLPNRANWDSAVRR